jgi:hypothetical protein
MIHPNYTDIEIKDQFWKWNAADEVNRNLRGDPRNIIQKKSFRIPWYVSRTQFAETMIEIITERN